MAHARPAKPGAPKKRTFGGEFLENTPISVRLLLAGILQSSASNLTVYQPMECKGDVAREINGLREVGVKRERERGRKR